MCMWLLNILLYFKNLKITFGNVLSAKKKETRICMGQHLTPNKKRQHQENHIHMPTFYQYFLGLYLL